MSIPSLEYLRSVQIVPFQRQLLIRSTENHIPAIIFISFVLCLYSFISKILCIFLLICLWSVFFPFKCQLHQRAGIFLSYSLQGLWYLEQCPGHCRCSRFWFNKWILPFEMQVVIKNEEKRFYSGKTSPTKEEFCWLNYNYLTYNYFSNNFDWIMSLDLKDKNFSFIANTV